jgi:lipopolysaccharide export system protein LptA
MKPRHLILAALLAVSSAPAFAQSLTFMPQDSDQPIVVDAEKGIEVQTDARRVIARGNAKASQGEVSIVGDELIAYYRARPQGGDEVYRVFAAGNVSMRSAEETATGESAVYDFDKGVLVLEGKLVRLANADGTVTAHNALQYWATERVAVAEGDAVAEDSEKRRVFADKLIAFFREDSPGAKPAAKATGVATAARGRGDITFLQGFGNVRVETPKETVRGERASYNIETGIVTLDGNVKLTQNQNVLSGGFAVVNVRGGTSRIYGSAKEAGMAGTRENPRVRALIAPSATPDPVAPRAPATSPASATSKAKP